MQYVHKMKARIITLGLVLLQIINAKVMDDLQQEYAEVTGEIRVAMMTRLLYSLEQITQAAQ